VSGSGGDPFRVARIDKTHGLRGEVSAAILTDFPERFGELEEVLSSIAAPTPVAAEPEEPREPEIAELDEIEDDESPPAKSAAARTADQRLSLGSDLGLRDLQGDSKPAAAPKGAALPQTEAFDNELEFLKALGDEKTKRPARASGATPRPAVAEPPAPEKPKPVENLSDQQALSRSRPSVINQRTLKCGECGAMNLPTEWYCDRCGAELASL